jgi:hypothetical protein
MPEPLKPPVELLILADKTPTQRGEDGARELARLRGVHNKSLHDEIQVLVFAFTSMTEGSALDFPTAAKRTCHTACAELGSLLGRTNPDDPRAVDSMIFRLEALRAQVAYQWQQAFIKHAPMAREYDDIEAFARASSIAEKDSEARAEITLMLSDATRVVQEVKTALDLCSMTYSQLDASIQSLHRLNSRRWDVTSRFNEATRNVEKRQTASESI